MKTVLAFISIGLLVTTGIFAQKKDPFAPGGLDTKKKVPAPSAPATKPTPTAQPTPGRTTPPPRISNPIPGKTMKNVKTIPHISADDDLFKLEESIRNQYIEGQFEYQDADIQDVVRAISKLTKKNFILDPKVRGKITIISPSKVTVQEVYEAFLSVLQMNEYTLVAAGRYLKIIRHQDAARNNIKTYSGDFTPNNDNYITRIYPLKYISAGDVARELRELVPRYGKITPYDPTNTVIITDTGRNIRRLIHIIKLLDVKGFELKLEVIPIFHAPAKELSTLIDSIISEKAGSSSNRRSSRNRRKGNRKKTDGGGEIAKIVPEERSNSLIVLANAKGIREIRGLVRKLDIAENDTTSGRIHVYYCKNTDATELAQTLANISSGGKQQQARPTRSGTRQNRNRGKNAAPKNVTAQFQGGIKITADKATNSLVIVASRGDYETLLKVIGRLDIPRKQVFVEAIIMEVQVGDDLNFGVHYNVSAGGLPRAAGFSPNGDLLSFFQSGVGLTGLVLGIAGGSSRDFSIGGQTVPIKTVTGLITAIQTYSESNILSTPQIMAIDNEESEIKIEDKIPVQGSSTTSATAGTTSNVVDKDLGISLSLTPQISGSKVRMKVDTTVTSLSVQNTPTGLSATNISTTERSAKTVVVIPDGDSVVIGGLIQETVLESEKKIPLLGDIPILGWLFKGKTNKRLKTNLLIFLSPKIVDNSKTLSEHSTSKIDERQSFIKTNLGGSDNFERYVKNLRQKIEYQKEKPNQSFGDKDYDAKPIPGRLKGNDETSQSVYGEVEEDDEDFDDPDDVEPVSNRPKAVPKVKEDDIDTILQRPPEE